MLHGFIRDFFLLLDKAIYSILSVIFQLIVDLANFRLFSNDAITSFSNRIYLILGIVMVFKLMISFIQMLINPDNMVDKEKGLSGILKRVVISLILIVMVRPIFDFARQLQEKLLPIIPKVIIAGRADVFNNDEVTTTAGNLLSYQTFTAFFYPYSQECQGMSHLSGIGDDSNATIGSVSDITSEEANMKGCSANPEDGYVYRYQYGISTIVGAFLIYVLVTIALKVAIRAIKLSLCEILAPIPIASYIDPKTSKQSFDKWVETSVKTYLDLFTRLAVVYFIIYVFDLIFTAPDGGISLFQNLVGQYKDFGRASLVAVFIIIGLLYFAKEMPKFITSMLGVPEGFTDIGDMFKGQGWKALGGAAGMAAAPFTTALGNYKYARRNGDNRARSLLSAAAGGAASLGRGVSAVSSKKGFNDSFWNNVATTTGNAHRRANERAIKRQLRREYEEGNASIDESISNVNNRYQNEGNTLNARRGSLLNLRDDMENRMGILQQRENNLRTNLENAQIELDNARQRVDLAQQNVNSAQASRDAAQTTLEETENNSRTRMENLVNQQNTSSKRADLLKRREIYQKYKEALENKDLLSPNVDYWKNRLNNARNDGEKEAARIGLNKAIADYTKVNELITSMQKEHGLSPANSNEIQGWINRTDNAISQLDRADEHARRNLQIEIDRDINLARTNLSNAEVALNNANNDLSTANSELNVKETAHTTIQTEFDTNHQNLNNLLQRYDENEIHINEVQTQINTLDERRESEINDLNQNRPEAINFTRDDIVNAINKAQGLSSITGSTYVDASQQLSSARSSYYTGEAMKKLKEEGSKVTRRFDLTDSSGHTVNATYSEIASALSDMRSGREPMINGERFTGSAHDLEEMFSLVEKNAAIEYINLVSQGVIKNTTIEEGNKQVAAMIEGLQIDEKTKADLRDQFNKDKGKFYKSLSDVSKKLETHGKRLQAYERAKKEQ